MMKTTRTHESNGNRYGFDFGPCSSKNGWAQIDTSQDAWYFGSWANPARLMVFDYTEGDCTLQQCESSEEFCELIHKIRAWNLDRGYTFAIDPMCNNDIEQQFRALGLGDVLY
jgi:hypothetical protein